MSLEEKLRAVAEQANYRLGLDQLIEAAALALEDAADAPFTKQVAEVPRLLLQGHELKGAHRFSKWLREQAAALRNEGRPESPERPGRTG